MNVTKEDAQLVLAMAWRGIEAMREWDQGSAKGKLRQSLGSEWAVAKTREFEQTRSRYYEIRDKWTQKK